MSLQGTEKEAKVCLGTLSLLLVLQDAYDGKYGVCVCVCVSPSPSIVDLWGLSYKKAVVLTTGQGGCCTLCPVIVNHMVVMINLVFTPLMSE